MTFLFEAVGIEVACGGGDDLLEEAGDLSI